MSDRVLHLLEDLMICVVVLLLGAYVLLNWAGAADKPELVAAYYSEGMRVPGAEAPQPVGDTSSVAAATASPQGEAGDGRTYLGRYYVTGYDTCAACCGKTDGITASGTTATVGRTCAANGVPFGTRLWIEGIGERTVEDRGGMRGQHIDVLCADHPACYAVTGYYEVWMYEPQI